MDVLTLQFADSTFETEIRRQRARQGVMLLSFVSVLLLASGLKTRYGHNWIHYLCVIFLITIPRWLKEDRCRRLFSMEPHTFGSICWPISWSVILARHQWRFYTGTELPVGPDDTLEALAICFLWMLTLACQRIMHIIPLSRYIVIVLAGWVCAINNDWRLSFFLALVVGEALGYALEYTLRESFLCNMEKIERLKCEKERIHYELLMAQKQQERQQEEQEHLHWQQQGIQQQSTQGTHSCGARSLRSHGKSDDASSSAFSELAALHSNARHPGPVCRERPGIEKASEPRSLSDAGSTCTSEKSGVLMSQDRMGALWRSLEQSGINALPESSKAT